jgi:hypothetical protein
MKNTQICTDIWYAAGDAGQRALGGHSRCDAVVEATAKRETY